MELLKKTGKALIIGTLAGVLIALTTQYFVADLIDRLENQSYYMRYYWKHRNFEDKNKQESENKKSDVCIIDIDDRSQQKMGMYWNWNRSYHAELINELKKKYPAAIVFDINFYDPEDPNHIKRFKKVIDKSRESNPDINLSQTEENAVLSSINYDDQFIRATRGAGMVYHAVRLSDASVYPQHALSQIEHKKTIEWHNSLHPSSTIELSAENRTKVMWEKEYIDGAFPALAEAAKDIGHVNISHNEDGVIREIPLLYGFKDHKPVYFPVSVRTIATLTGTKNSEIVFEPGKYIELGSPFKITKDEQGALSFSYPNVTASQIKALFDRKKDILSLTPGNILLISSLLKIGVDENGEEYISMSCGDMPGPLVKTLESVDFDKIINMDIGSDYRISDVSSFTRSSDIEWVLKAPYGFEEWYMTMDEVNTLSMLDFEEFGGLKNGEEKLIFYNFEVENSGLVLRSTIPVLRGKTLKDLLSRNWEEIESMEPGTRMEFGEKIQIPLTPSNRHIVTYFGQKGEPFNYYSYYDIMEGRVHGNLAGKIFLVGSTVPSMFDIVSVPMEQEYPGVEVHASLMHSILTNKYITRLGSLQEFLILLIVGIMIGFIAYTLKPLPGSILTIVMIFVYFLVAMTVFGADNLWIPIARPILTIILTYSAVMAYRYITEEKDRKFLQNTFKAYLSPELIDMMYKEKQSPQLGGDEGIRTAYFTDIQSFSTFSEKLGSPTRLVELLNEYLTAMTDILLEHYGTLDKYEGDAIIAFFGAPMPMDDHVPQACKTALAMQNRLGELREKWSQEEGKWPKIVHDMRMRIGINTGRITTGNMGSAVRMNYTMMGDAVNLAARLEAAAKQYGVYTMISDKTYQYIKDDFELRQIDKITVVGKSEPVTAYELISEKGQMGEEYKKLLPVYQEGIELFYTQKWDKAIEVLTESEKLEPFRDIAPNNMSPSRKIIEYSKMYKEDPPGSDWDGVMKLTSK